MARVELLFGGERARAVPALILDPDGLAERGGGVAFATPSLLEVSPAAREPRAALAFECVPVACGRVDLQLALANVARAAIDREHLGVAVAHRGRETLDGIARVLIAGTQIQHARRRAASRRRDDWQAGRG